MIALSEGIKLPNNYKILRTACEGYKVNNVDVIFSTIDYYNWHVKLNIVKEPEYYFDKLSEINKGQFIDFNLRELFCALIYTRTGQFWNLGESKDNITDIKQGDILRRIKDNSQEEHLICLLGCNIGNDSWGYFIHEETDVVINIAIQKDIYEILKPIAI